MVIRPLALALATALLSACAVGPDFVRPELAVPAQFEHATAANAATIADDAGFWRGFDDPLLTELVEEALAANHDLRIALANVDRAEALRRGSRLDALPRVTADADVSGSRASADQLPGVARSDRDVDSVAVNARASWEVDLFGRVRRGVEAANADAAASQADLRAMQVAIVGDLARSYVGLRGLQERARVARANADNQRETLTLVQARFDAGRDTAFDTARARAQREATLAQVAALDAEVGIAIHRIAVLAGRMPDALDAELSAVAPLPAVPAAPDPGTPGELLRRRPDVAAAEQRLHAATARIGVATADLFPRFTLGALIGSQAATGSALFGRDSETGLVALGIDWSFLDTGRVRARIGAADADAQAALAQYQRSVLLSLRDTGDALLRLDQARIEDTHLQQAASDSADAARLARLRYQAGASGLLEVLDAECTRLSAEDAFAAARTRSVERAIALHQALAGGWPRQLPRRVGLAEAD